MGLYFWFTEKAFGVDLIIIYLFIFTGFNSERLIIFGSCLLWCAKSRPDWCCRSISGRMMWFTELFNKTKCYFTVVATSCIFIDLLNDHFNW